jgi:phosphoribosylglycinamide formyltransferase-1
LAAGEGSNLQALIDAERKGLLNAEIAVVASHRPGAGALARARTAGIPTIALGPVDPRDGPGRRHFEEELLRHLGHFSLDLIILAGWMLILSREFLSSCRCPVINVHPALLDPPADFPVIRGAHAVRDALLIGLPYTGVSVHWVTPEVDSGPVIRSEAVDILPEDDEASLYQRVKPVEHRLLVEAVRSVLAPAYGGMHARNPA